jgi:hypothetical protein
MHVASLQLGDHDLPVARGSKALDVVRREHRSLLDRAFAISEPKGVRENRTLQSVRIDVDFVELHRTEILRRSLAGWKDSEPEILALPFVVDRQ